MLLVVQGLSCDYREYSKMCSIRYVDFKDKTPEPGKRVSKESKPLRDVSNEAENIPLNLSDATN